MNILGYYGVFVGLQYTNGVALDRQLDEDQYDASRLVTFEIPFAVPYMYDDPEFKRVDGVFEFKGQSYRLVKQKYERDTLTVVCLLDSEDQRLSKAMADYVKTFGDSSEDQNQSTQSSTSFLKDYLPGSILIESVSEGWLASFEDTGYLNNLIPTYSAAVIHPPESI